MCIRDSDSRPFTKSNLAGRSFCLGVMPIPCPHFKITIVKRSHGQSAVAGAAYQSGERLFSEYDQRTKSVSYTHLDVYKRQDIYRQIGEAVPPFLAAGITVDVLVELLSTVPTIDELANGVAAITEPVSSS